MLEPYPLLWARVAKQKTTVSAQMFTGMNDKQVQALHILWRPTAGDKAQKYREIITNRQRGVVPTTGYELKTLPRPRLGFGEQKAFNWCNEPLSYRFHLCTSIQLAADM